MIEIYSKFMDKKAGAGLFLDLELKIALQASPLAEHGKKTKFL